ncbi:MAG: DHH family phosphoesterase [Lachnospiraceae bacterium]
MDQKISYKGHLRIFMYGPMFLTIVLILFNIPIYCINLKAGVIVSTFALVYFVCMLALYLWNRSMIVSELVNFAANYGSVQKKLLEEFEIPFALMDYNGRLMWVNKKFAELTGKDKKYHKSIFTIFPSLTKEQIQNSREEGIHFKLEWHDYVFRAETRSISITQVLEESSLVKTTIDANQYFSIIYLFDETELTHYIQQNKDQKLVAGMIYIDNFDEALESIEDVKRSFLVALVDRKVNKYFQEVDALVRKTEKDKYFVVFKYQYLKTLIDDKFSLTDDVKTVKVGNEMAVTLSIGIGIRGNNYNGNYEYARMAIDLALGRGGDQAVVKEGDNIHYFGGKSKSVERNTRVKARVKAHALRETFISHDNVIIMGHSISDIDSFGAAIGIYCAARVLDKKAQIVINQVTSSLRPILELFNTENGYSSDMFIDSNGALNALQENSLVMVVDTNRPNYTECPELIELSHSIVVFDHHRQSSDIIKNPLLSYIEPYSSSTCEMVAEVLQYFAENIKLSSMEADAIYAGILIDTNNFMTKTGVRTFEAAAYLRRCGAEVTRVRKLLRNDMDSYKARAEIVQNAEVYRNAFAISAFSSSVESPTVVGAQAANELLNIIGIKASFVLTEFKGKVYISSRSIDEINVQLIMERLGGGGHMNVAGTQLSECTIEEAKKAIEDTLDEMIKEGEIEL